MCKELHVNIKESDVKSKHVMNPAKITESWKESYVREMNHV